MSLLKMGKMLLGSAIIMTTLIGCMNTSTQKRELHVIEKEDKLSSELNIEQIHRIEGWAYVTWLSNIEVYLDSLIDDGGRKAAIYQLDTEQMQVTGEVVSENDSWGLRENLSPDGKFMITERFINKYNVEISLRNMNTEEVKLIDIPNDMPRGAWLNADTYMLCTGIDGQMVKISTEGKVTSVSLDVSVAPVPRIETSGGYVFYDGYEGGLYRLDPTNGMTEQFTPASRDFSISPDGNTIAVVTYNSVQLTDSDKLTLFNLSGEVIGTTIASADLIQYPSWSLDSSRLTFSAYSGDGEGMSGLYILDVNTGKVTLVGPGRSATGMTGWSPSNDKFAITMYEEDMTITEIYELK